MKTAGRVQHLGNRLRCHVLVLADGILTLVHDLSDGRPGNVAGTEVQHSDQELCKQSAQPNQRSSIGEFRVGQCKHTLMSVSRSHFILATLSMREFSAGWFCVSG